MAKRMLTEPKTALTGVMAEISFARFRTSMVTFNAERIVSFSFCGSDFEVIVVSGRKGDKRQAVT